MGFTELSNVAPFSEFLVGKKSFFTEDTVARRALNSFGSSDSTPGSQFRTGPCRVVPSVPCRAGPGRGCHR